VSLGERRITLITRRRGLPAGDLAALVARAAQAGVDFVQVREKELEGAALRDLVASVVRAVAGTATRVLVNGRPDVAAATGAHGVQLPEDGLPVAAVRRGFPGLLVGASRHALASALAAERDGADFVLLGPVFATPGKDRALGLDALAAAARALRVPVHAVGGIDAARAPEVWNAGATGVAAIRAFLVGEDQIAARVAELRSGGSA
jgi:thiamine-phosphate pyrophosphorylase